MLVMYALLIATSPLPGIPHPSDTDGWGLRSLRLSRPGPYFVGEDIGRVQFQFAMFNFSKDTRSYDTLPIIQFAGMLRVDLYKPDGKWLPNRHCEICPLDPMRVRPKLRPGEFASFAIPLYDSSYSTMSETGRFRVEASYWLDKTQLKATIEYDVVRLPSYSILGSHELPLEGHEATLPLNERSRAFVQQVEFGNRALLNYRRALGSRWGGHSYIVRLVDLPRKVELKVSGTYGDWKPITISHIDPSGKGMSTLVISPVDGVPWTAEVKREVDEMRTREERWPEKQKLIPITPTPYALAPAPRPYRQ